MDDTPKGFLGELKSATLKKRVGQIAMAVVLAEACIRFLNSLVWFLVLPIISSLLKGHTESVLFETKPTFPVERLLAAILEFGAAIIFVFYVNRWIHATPPEPTVSPEQGRRIGDPDPEVFYNLTGDQLSSMDQPDLKK
jgi:large-conductance mechanosensitive channel